MTNSFSQKIQITLLRTLIFSIWVFDWVSLFPLSYIVLKLRKVFLILFLSILLIGTFYLVVRNDDTEQSSIAIPSDLAFEAPQSSSTFADVLGAQNPKSEEIPSEIKFPEPKTEAGPKPEVSAKSVLAKDVLTDKTLFEKAPNLILAPASTTKLMTALVAVKNYSLEDVFVVPVDCTTIDSTKAWLPAGSSFKVQDLLSVLLVSSAGDAACTLGYGPESTYDIFVSEMNETARKLQMKNTFFTNTIGLDGYASSHYSTAEDLYILAKESIKNVTIKELVKTKDFSVKSEDGSYNFTGQNTNTLLWELDGTVGIKTGTTVEAGEVLIYEYEKDGKNIIIVVMGSSNRFADTKAILNWILDSFIFPAV